MIDIPTETLPVERFAAGAWGLNGKYQKGALENLNVEASVQGLTSNELKLLPEHKRSAESIKLYVFKGDRLRIADEANNLPADIIIHDGKRFEIFKVWNWAIGTDIPHYKCIAVKEDGQGGGNAV